MSLCALLVIGVIAERHIPVQLLPSGFSSPFMWVEVPTLPAAPADNERAIAEPLEEGLGTLPGLARLRTHVDSTSVGFRVELDAQADPDLAYEQVRDRLDRTLPKLPEGARHALIWRHDPNESPVYILGVTYPPGTRDAYRLVQDHLARPLERLPGVSRVNLWGLRDDKLRIEIDDDAARVHGVDTRALVQQLERDNFTMGVGALEEGGRRVLVRAAARFGGLDEIRALPVAPGVRLGDVARVHFAPDPNPELHRIDGAPAATLMVFKEATANTVETTRRVDAEVRARMTADAALGEVRSEVFFDQGGYIRSSIDELQASALVGGAIAVVILLFFLRSLGMTLLVTLAIPLCLLATVVVLYFSGDSLNVLSLMGLMLSVGMVVDNAIVVLENIDRHRRLGQSGDTAAVAGAGEVALAITLATLTTLVVFLPMILLADKPMIAFYLGKIGFPVCYALLASLFVALVYIPAGARRFRAPAAEQQQGWLLTRLTAAYGTALGWTLRHRLPAAGVVIAAIASTALPAGRVQRVDQLEGGLDSVRMHVRGPHNGRPEELDATVRVLEARLLERKAELDIRAVLARQGWSGNHAVVEVFFVDVGDRTREREAVVEALRGLLPERPGYRSRLGWRGGGGNDEGGLTIELTGPDTDLATELAQEVAARLRLLDAVDEVTLEDAESGSELRYHVVREVADRAGLTPLVIGGTIDYSLRGRRLADFHTPERTVEVRVELAEAHRDDVERVGHLPVRDVTGRGGAPIGAVTRTVRSPGYGRIVREDRRTEVDIRVVGDEKRLFNDLVAEAARIPLPPGYAIDFGDRFRNRSDNEEGGRFAILVAIALVFFLMGVLFESFILPFSIILSIPLAFAGVFWTLYLTRTPLDVMAIVGCVILVGVVVNNGIVLIDRVQQRRAAGVPRDQALVEVARQRVRPILMTAMTTIGGLIPMATGHASLLGIEYHPLGRVVIGGLLSGTVLTLFAVPLFYTLLDDLGYLPHRLRLLGGVRAAAPAPPEA